MDVERLKGSSIFILTRDLERYIGDILSLDEGILTLSNVVTLTKEGTPTNKKEDKKEFDVHSILELNLQNTPQRMYQQPVYGDMSGQGYYGGYYPPMYGMDQYSGYNYYPQPMVHYPQPPMGVGHPPYMDLSPTINAVEQMSIREEGTNQQESVPQSQGNAPHAQENVSKENHEQIRHEEDQKQATKKVKKDLSVEKPKSPKKVVNVKTKNAETSTEAKPQQYQKEQTGRKHQKNDNHRNTQRNQKDTSAQGPRTKTQNQFRPSRRPYNKHHKSDAAKKNEVAKLLKQEFDFDAIKDIDRSATLENNNEEVVEDPPVVYNKKVSFFDNLSMEPNTREDRKKSREVDRETFGVTNRRHYRPRGGRYHRGGRYNRGGRRYHHQRPRREVKATTEE